MHVRPSFRIQAATTLLRHFYHQFRVYGQGVSVTENCDIRERKKKEVKAWVSEWERVNLINPPYIHPEEINRPLAYYETVRKNKGCAVPVDIFQFCYDLTKLFKRNPLPPSMFTWIIESCHGLGDFNNSLWNRIHLLPHRCSRKQNLIDCASR